VTFGRSFCLVLAVCFINLQAAPMARAQDYPVRPVTLIVPFAPGGSVDIVARTLGQKLAERLGQPVVVENRPGAGAGIAYAAVAKTVPDGYTLLIAPNSLAINASLYKKLPYDPAKDFAPVALVARIPLLLIVNPKLPVRSLAELIKFAKERPGELSYASSGQGSSLHLAAELFKRMTGLEMTHIPYKGGAPALSDVVAGHVSLMFVDPGPSVPQIKEGKVRVLGVSSQTRVPAVPDIPPIAETAVPGFEAVSWQLIVAPANTAKAIVNKLHAEVKDLVETPEIQQRLVTLGLIPVSSPPPDELQLFVQSEIMRWGEIIQQAGIAKLE
jgi:tripartite-type tricarboxylate transporter receptor subunit TctC